MNQYSREPEFIVAEQSGKMHLSIAQLRDIKSSSLVLIAQKLERLLLLDDMSTTYLKEIQKLSDTLGLLERD